MNALIKNFLLTATLATAAFVGGYQLDNIVNTACGARSYFQGVTADPQAAFWACWNAHPDAITCKAQASAWAAQDGREYVMRQAAGRVLADSLTRALVPAK